MSPWAAGRPTNEVESIEQRRKPLGAERLVPTRTLTHQEWQSDVLADSEFLEESGHLGHGGHLVPAQLAGVA